MLRICCVLWLCVCAMYAESKTYALSIYGTLKYPQNFTHFDYANPNAPKGGTLKGFALVIALIPLHKKAMRLRSLAHLYIIHSLFKA